MATCAARWQCLSKNSAAIPYHRHRPQEPAMTDTKAVAKPLTPEAEHVLRRHGTERPGSSKLNHEKRPGVFRCAGCGTAVFASDTKYESGSGWPSFWAPAGDGPGDRK